MDLSKVPIIGGRKVMLVCPRGHVEEAPGPFTWDMPSADGQIVRRPVCRPCVADFLAWNFPVHVATPEEVEQIARMRAAQQQQPAGG